MNQDLQDTTGKYLAFNLKNEQYAIPLLQVKEVIGMTAMTPIPKSPAHFKGIMNLRGQVISIIDLRIKLQLAKSDDGQETSIVLLDLKDLFLGIIVDSVNSVLALNSNDLSQISDPSARRESYVKGVAKHDNRLTLLLDMEAILNPQDLALINNNEQKQSAA